MTTRILIAVTILTGFAAFAVVGQERNWVGIEHSYGSPRHPSAADQIEQALGVRGKWNYTDNPLDEAMKQVGQRFNINIWIDKEALTAEGIAADQPVNLVLPDASLATGLELILEPLYLTYVIQDEVLTITTQQKADEARTTRVYPVRDLLDAGEHGHDDYEWLMTAIQETTNGKWEELDGEGGAISPVPNARSLVILASQHVHRNVEGLLTALRKAKRLQRIPSLPINYDDIEELRPEMPVAPRAASRVRVSRATQSWQQPRVYSE